MRIAIIGSRSFNDVLFMDSCLCEVCPKVTMVVSGGARGADTLGAEWAAKNGKECLVFLPDWKTHPKKAGFLRNQQIIDAADFIFAFWDGQSSGTLDSIKKAGKAKKPILIFWPPESSQSSLLWE